MPCSHTIPRRFNPAYSFLGRALLRLVEDERRAKALFIVTLTSLALILLLAQYLTWALLWPGLSAAPGYPTLLAYWAAQLGTAALYVVTCVLGFQAPISARCTPDGLFLRQGRRLVTVSREAITSVETISALLFHRHYRRYAATEIFVNRIPEHLLLVRTAQRAVVIGLPAAVHARVAAHLGAQWSTGVASGVASNVARVA